MPEYCGDHRLAGLYLDMRSYHDKMWWSLEAARFGFSLSDGFENWQAIGSSADGFHISEHYYNHSIQSADAVHSISSLRVCISTRFRPSSHPCIHPPACFLFGAFEMSCSHFILISYTTVPNATDKNRHGLKWCYNVYRLKECQCLEGMSSTHYNFGKWHVSAS